MRIVKEDHPLRDRIGELLEIIIYFPSGSVRVVGNLMLVNAARPFLSIGGAHLPIDAIVRVESFGHGLVFDSGGHAEAKEAEAANQEASEAAAAEAFGN